MRRQARLFRSICYRKNAVVGWLEVANGNNRHNTQTDE